jgi:DnaK suppressor protein
MGHTIFELAEQDGDASTMTPEQLEYFRTLFNQKIDELLREAGKTVSGMTGTTESFPDLTDRASQESDRDFELRIRDRERKLIKKMREALERIDNGTFGICVSCGKKISEKRLMARPVTLLCIDCKKKQEELEKQRGD